MSQEANFSYTRKVDGELFTVRGDTYSELEAHAHEAFGADVWNTVLASARGGAAYVNPRPFPVTQATQDQTQKLLGAVEVARELNATMGPSEPAAAEKPKDFTIKNPGDPASDAQKGLINKLSKGTYPSKDLTKGQAKDVIDQLMNAQKKG